MTDYMKLKAAQLSGLLFMLLGLAGAVLQFVPETIILDDQVVFASHIPAYTTPALMLAGIIGTCFSVLLYVTYYYRIGKARIAQINHRNKLWLQKHWWQVGLGFAVAALAITYLLLLFIVNIAT